jgi:hypothetical protein
MPSRTISNLNGKHTKENTYISEREIKTFD